MGLSFGFIFQFFRYGGLSFNAFLVSDMFFLGTRDLSFNLLLEEGGLFCVALCDEAG